MSSQIQGEYFPHPVPLQVYLLGPPRVEWGGSPLLIPRRQTRALLYRLATQTQPIPREQLCFLFWPDTAESTARRNLSHLLTHLRHALPAPEYLSLAEDCVALNATRVWSDAVAFYRLCSNSPLLSRLSLPRFQEREEEIRKQSDEALQQAIDLYRGPFLDGFYLHESPEFEVWLTQEQQAYERLYLKALALLIEEHAYIGEYEAAIAYAQRYLETDNLAEEIHRRLMELYAVVGNRSAALRQFERCIAALERELGIGPLPETRAVYQSILEEQPWSGWAVKPVWTTLPSLNVPLIGRNEVIHRLMQAFARARGGQGGVVLISGEAGIGKSRLMQDLATRLEDRALILVGEGHPEAQTIPYQPIVQALRNLLSRDAAPLFPRSFAQTWLVEASRLLPELRILYPDLPLPPPIEPDEGRSRLFEALAQIILGLATSPLILCLDDLHWADRSTLDWLAHLGRRLRGNRLLIIGTYRSEEAEAMADLRHNLTRLGVLFEVKLVGLDTAAVSQMLHHLPLSLSQWKGDAKRVAGEVTLVERLQKATGGNPFFLLEILRALMEKDRLSEGWVAVEELLLPDTVRQAVEARLRHLSSIARQILEAGAIVGLTFDPNLVRLTAGRRELETMDGLDELVARQLLVESAEASGARFYRFQHEIVQRAVESTLSPVRCQLLHRRAGRALERLQPNAVAALARHFEAGGETKKALYYHGMAAQQAEAMFAWREAEEHQSRMLVLLEHLDPECTKPDYLTQRGQVLTARARQRYLQGRLEERDADLVTLDNLAKASGETELQLQVLLHRTRYLNLEGQYEAAITTAEEGLACLIPIPGLALLRATLCRLLVEKGFAHYFLGQPREGLATLESALTIATEKADAGLRGAVVHNLGYLYLHLGEHARALAYQQEAYACHQAVGDFNGMSWSKLDTGFLHLKLGHFLEAEQYLNESLVLAQRIGARPAEAYARTYLGYWELYRGRYTTAAECFQQNLPMHQAVRQEHGIVAAEVGLGLALYHLGDYAEADCRLLDAIKRARAVTHRRRLVEALVALSLVELTNNRTRTAHQYLSEAVELAYLSEFREGLATGLSVLACFERLIGATTDALRHAREAVRIAHGGDLPACQMWGEMELGLTLLAQGEAVAALEHTERAIALCSHSHEGWIGSETVYHANACVLSALDRAKEAQEHTQRAASIIEDKARCITDLKQRQRFLRSVEGRLSQI